MAESQYEERARARILELVDEHLALAVSELEARISEAGFAGSGLNIDPHHVTRALRQLVNDGIIERVTEPTRGGATVTTVQPVDQRKRSTAIAKAARRKRLLYGRYLGWANSTVRHPNGRLGPAGEEAVRTALRAAGALQPLNDYGEVATLLGTRLPGAVDSAGVLVPFTQGIPGQPVTVLIEVKNIRGCIYPQNVELYQVLSKACLLQQAHPEQPIVPVFICRKAHTTTFWMASQLGFLVIDMGAQFVGDVDDQSLNEVRSELHFTDLYRGTGPSRRVQERFQSTVPRICTATAARWKTTALNLDLATTITALNNAKTSSSQRRPLMDALRRYTQEAGHRGGW